MILVCAATGTEAGACRRGIADARAPGFEVLTMGVGPARAAAALRARLGDPSRERPTLVVSSGFAGALSPEIEQLSWVTASSVHRLIDGRALPVLLPRELLRTVEGAVACHVISADHVVAGSDGGARHPAAVDMESAALADVAGAAGIAFAVLRLVTDTPARPLAVVGRKIAATLAAPDAVRQATRGARVAAEAVRSPRSALAFVRESLGWRERLREGWREHARRGLR